MDYYNIYGEYIIEKFTDEDDEPETETTSYAISTQKCSEYNKCCKNIEGKNKSTYFSKSSTCQTCPIGSTLKNEACISENKDFTILSTETTCTTGTKYKNNCVTCPEGYSVNTKVGKCVSAGDEIDIVDTVRNYRIMNNKKKCNIGKGEDYVENNKRCYDVCPAGTYSIPIINESGESVRHCRTKCNKPRYKESQDNKKCMQIFPQDATVYRTKIPPSIVYISID
jgi:hypothetical protein